MSNPLNILITGATAGFGRQTAEKLASDGHQVFATARGVDGKNAEAAQSLELTNFDDIGRRRYFDESAIGDRTNALGTGVPFGQGSARRAGQSKQGR